MRAVMDILGKIGVEGDVGILSAHHTPKPDKASSRGFAGNVNAARGASAIVDAARGTVNKSMSMSEDDEKKWKLPPGESRSKFVRLDDARMQTFAHSAKTRGGLSASRCISAAISEKLATCYGL